LVRHGVSLRHACARSGIPQGTLQQICERDSKLLSRITEARAGLIEELVGRVREHAKKDWRAASWFLERLDPAAYRLPNVAVLEGAGDYGQLRCKADDEQVQRMVQEMYAAVKESQKEKAAPAVMRELVAESVSELRVARESERLEPGAEAREAKETRQSKAPEPCAGDSLLARTAAAEAAEARWQVQAAYAQDARDRRAREAQRRLNEAPWIY
jgi:hypothetical protein